MGRLSPFSFPPFEGVLHFPWDTSNRRHRAGLKLSPEVQKALRKGRENAEVVLNYGKPALIAMAGRGIGPTVVKRILAGSHERPESEFYRLVLENEKQFIRTREWWAESKPK